VFFPRKPALFWELVQAPPNGWGTVTRWKNTFKLKSDLDHFGKNAEKTGLSAATPLGESGAMGIQASSMVELETI
jgi:hypothetical protein